MRGTYSNPAACSDLSVLDCSGIDRNSNSVPSTSSLCSSAIPPFVEAEKTNSESGWDAEVVGCGIRADGMLAGSAF